MRIAVTGLSHGEHSRTATALIAGIRSAHPEAFVVGLASDTVEGDVYSGEGPHAVFHLPTAGVSAESYLRRLDLIHQVAPFDALIPTRTVELPFFVPLVTELQSRGIRTCLPGEEGLQKRSREHLPATAAAAGIRMPATRMVYTIGQALEHAREVAFPLMVKGRACDTQQVDTVAELAGAVSLLFAQGGAPVLLQETVCGVEHHIMGIGDGMGGVTGLCAIRRHLQRRNAGGVTVVDVDLRDLCHRLVSVLKWRGPFEIVTIAEERGHHHLLIKMDPCFPSWMGFPCGFGLNFPSALARFALSGTPPAPLREAKPGWFFIRSGVNVLEPPSWEDLEEKFAHELPSGTHAAPALQQF